MLRKTIRSQVNNLAFFVAHMNEVLRENLF